MATATINPSVAQVSGNTSGPNGSKKSATILKPSLDVGRTDTANMTDEAWFHLLAPWSGEPETFYHEVSNSLVHLTPQESGALTIVPATHESLAYRLSKHI